MKYYCVVELIEEEGPLEEGVMERRNYPCKSYKDAVGMFKLLNRNYPKSSPNKQK